MISGKISSERLNFVLAVSAILISGASFYATYLQAISAEKQVKAMTMPLIQFSHGNYDDEEDRKAITFKLANAGVGPAVIRNVSFNYQNAEYASPSDFFNACCEVEWRNFKSKLDPNKEVYEDGLFSSPLVDSTIPGQSEYEFQKIYYSDVSKELWNKLNEERWDLELEVCYCSLLDECYTTEKAGIVTQTDMCPE